MKMQKLFTFIVLSLLIVTLIFIFSNSLEPVAESSEKSQYTMNRFAPLLGIIFGKGNVTENLVRKIAHFAEFTVLGSELLLLAAVNWRVSFQSISNCLFFGLIAALTDESIQMLTDRSPEVKDMLLDFSGVLAGVLIILFLIFLPKLLKAKQLKT